MFDTDSVDVRFAPKADYDYERVRMEIDLCGYLYDDAVDGKIRAVDEFGVGFGGVVGCTVLGPNLVVDGFFGLLDMQFTRFAGCIDATEVIDTVGDIGRLLDLHEEITGSDGMETSCRQEV